ncbi:tetratricopeptide repeat protein [Blautia sp. RD014234]|nr:tetratricopeptide repeat protein [Blautia parvula]
MENFELAIAEEKYEVEALRGEGIAYLKMGKYEEAQQALEKPGTWPLIRRRP